MAFLAGISSYSENIVTTGNVPKKQSIMITFHHNAECALEKNSRF